MNASRSLPRLISTGFALCAAFAMTPARAAETPQLATQFDFSSDTTPGARKFYFATVPGHRYSLWRSTDLQNWAILPGYPKTATDVSMEHTFSQQQKEFFRIEPIDDQMPEIVDQFPGVDAYAVRRFDDLRFQLDDATGIAPGSIRLTVGNGAALAVGAPGLTFAGNVLTYDSGDAALGAYGAMVPVSLTFADTLGHSVTHTFSFTLEVLPKVRGNLYVFGSPAAQRAGQQIPATPTAALGRPTGPVPMDGPDPWEIESVLPDRIVIAYTGATAPVFAAGTYLANLTPVKFTDIFYRKILSASDAPATKKLTLMTTDVPIAEIVEEGTATLSADSKVYDLDDAGTIQPAVQVSFSRTFPRMGINLDGTGPLALPGNPKFSVSLPEANLWLTPSLEFAFETKGFAVERAGMLARGDIQAALVPELTYRPSGTETTKEKALHQPVRKLVFVGVIGPVPVWLDFTYSTTLKFEAAADAAVTLRCGWRRNFFISAGAAYSKDASPKVAWTRNTSASPLADVPLTLSGSGTSNAKVSVVPQLDVRLVSVLGFQVNLNPRAEAQLTADGSLTFSPKDSSIQMAASGTATLSGGVFADLNAGLSVIGVNPSDLPAMPPLRLFSRAWVGTYPDEFVLIPAGRFQMGDQSSPLVGWSGELPVHTVNVSAFYMGKYEVTKGEWDVVRAWGLTNGYTDLPAGGGKAANHPVHSITWFAMVKWCNARSQKEGLTPCYTVSGSIYKTGNSAPVCNWSANGYRLPTEAEWEKAARGGQTGLNFPWGNTITHSHANFWNSGGETYQSGTTGAHPTYAVGGYPYSSPVGSFAPNGYGLYDMAGNMWEWCWDWYGSYAAGSQTDPRGASSGAGRVLRGGGCYGDAYNCRVAARDDYNPTDGYGGIGFRIARSSVP